MALSGNKKVRRALRKQLNRLAWLKVSDPPLPIDPLPHIAPFYLKPDRYATAAPTLTLIRDGEVVYSATLDPDR
jgi:hypothetical protein